MKNVTLKAFIYAAAAFVISAIPGFAQVNGHVSVKVPFEFTAGTSTLPAGDYNFQEEQNGIVLISSTQQHRSVMVLTNPDVAWRLNSQSGVKFDKLDGQYTLSEVGLLGEPSRKIIHLERDSPMASVNAKLGVTNASAKGLKK